MHGQLAKLLILALFLVTCLPAGGRAAEPVRVAVLKFGTVNWELDVIQANGFDKAAGIELEILPLAGKEATSVALQAGEVDLIVGDWVWVSRQRAEGVPFTLVPYSTGLGALVVPEASAIRSVADLAGRRLGVAGGPLDKSWLLLQALARERDGLDLAAEAEPVFAAPPLLNEQLAAERLDAVLTFWPYAARLEAQGYRRLLGVEEMIGRLGIEGPLPMVGYIFDEGWASANPARIAGFIEATQAARRRMAESDEEWERLRPLMQAENEAVFRALRDGFRAGIPERWGEAERAEAARLFALLAEIGGPTLVGRSDELQAGTFWEGSGWQGSGD